jgi:hypothetical protein
MAKFQQNTRNAASPTPQSMTTTFKTLIELSSAATGRGQIYEVNVGADGPPNATDCQIVYDWSRMTASGTAVASTPNPMNPADAASRTTSKINNTAEPTVTAQSSLLELCLNQRASQRWIAAPGSELIWPNTSANGIACRALSPTYASNVLMHAFYDDL